LNSYTDPKVDLKGGVFRIPPEDLGLLFRSETPAFQENGFQKSLLDFRARGENHLPSTAGLRLHQFGFDQCTLAASEKCVAFNASRVAEAVIKKPDVANWLRGCIK